MKMQANRNRTDREFSVGDQVLLKLQPYTQSSVASRPYPKLAYKFFGPYKVTARIGKVAYRLELPDSSNIHQVFHISQLKPYTPNYTPVFSTLPMLTDLQATETEPEMIRDRPVGEKGEQCNPSSPGDMVRSAQVDSHLGRLPCAASKVSTCACLGTSKISRRGRCHSYGVKA